jgi:hypothetical protein
MIKNKTTNRIVIMKKLLVVIVVISSTIIVNAQGRYGKDSLECLKALNFYSDYMKQNDIEKAAPLWRNAIKFCPPGVRQTLYQDGQKIFASFVDNNVNPENKSAYIDSLLMMYDLRVQYFPNYALSARMYKVYDMVKYSVDSKEIFTLAKETVSMGQDKVSPTIMVIAMQHGSQLVSNGQVGVEEFLSLYTNFSEIADKQIASNTEGAAEAKAAIDNLFVTSGIASCENIITLFTPKFEAEPNNLDLVQTIVNLLNNAECIESDLFLKTVEALNRMAPSYNTNYFLFRLYAGKNDHENALKYLQAAIDSDESNETRDAELLIDGAYYHLKLSNAARAIDFARQAMNKSESQKGRGNFIIGSAWAATSCSSGNEVERAAKYWVIVDYMNRAKSADASLLDDANNYINMYSKQFPLQEEAFMYDLVDGASYTVSCGGMRETTTVRTRK